jgi:hypothetical protein
MRSFPRFPSGISTFAFSVLLIAAVAGIAYSYRNLFSSPISANSKSLTKLPHVIFWAWERPERLDHLDSSKATVAFLAQTIQLRGERSLVRPRLQPLSVTPTAPLIAVTRIESDPHERPALNSAQLTETIDALERVSRLPRVVAVQIDFDATLSERAFYRSLIFALREKLPESTALSITALASWCKGDNWLDELPIDEAVPMLFRMGQERNQFLAALNSGEPFRSVKCQESVGISTDEPISGLPFPRRVYVFNNQSWSPESTNQLLRKIENEQAR